MPERRMEIDGDPVLFRVQNAALIAAGPSGGHVLETPARRERLDDYPEEELAGLWRWRWTKYVA